MSWQGELKIMEERLRLQMSSATRPYDTRTSLKCMAILSAFGLCAAACYPLLWVGMVVIAFSKSSQLYAAPLVVLAALGTVYGSSMLMIYYVNWRFHVPLADMAMALVIAMICLTLVTVAERHYESTKEKQTEALSRRLRQLLAYFKYTVTPVATLSCILQFAWPSALLYATSFMVLLKIFRAALLKLTWAGCPKPGEQMRVLLSGDSFPPKLDGVQNFARNTIQALVRDGHKVHVFL
mmetsp:Transcript_69461/g.140738  ORF Transcript_69461/g.140738 Transcript_69461/m.140738 type:complete len:238 (-) Transcript_69461:10-723(-)